MYSLKQVAPNRLSQFKQTPKQYLCLVLATSIVLLLQPVSISAKMITVHIKNNTAFKLEVGYCKKKQAATSDCLSNNQTKIAPQQQTAFQCEQRDFDTCRIVFRTTDLPQKILGISQSAKTVKNGKTLTITGQFKKKSNPCLYYKFTKKVS